MSQFDQPQQQPRPAKRRKGRNCVVAAIGATALVLALALVGAFAWPGWFSGDTQRAAAAADHPRPQADRLHLDIDYHNPHAVAREFVRVTEAKNLEQLKALACPRLTKQLASGKGARGYRMLLRTAKIDTKFAGPLRVHGDRATVRMHEHVSGALMNTSMVLRLSLRQHDGGWRICAAHPEHGPAGR